MAKDSNLAGTQIPRNEALTDQQLVKAISIAEAKANGATNDSDRQRYVSYAKTAYQTLKERNGAGYVQVEAAKQLGTKLESVNPYKSLSVMERLAYTFLPDTEQKQYYLQNKFGRDNVQTVSVEGKERFFIKQGTEWGTVDEVPLTAKDFTVDIANQVPAALAEVATAYGTSGLTTLPRVLRFAAPEIAGFVTQVAADVLPAMAIGVDPKAKQAVAQNLLWTGGAMGLEVGGRRFARMVSAKPKNELVENVKNASLSLRQNNVGPDLKQGIKTGGGWLRMPFMRATADLDKTVSDITESITGQSSRDFAQDLERYAQVQLQTNARLANEVAARESQNVLRTRRVIQNIGQKRVSALAAKPFEPPHVRGNTFRSGDQGLEAGYQRFKKKAAEQYDAVLARSDQMPGVIDATELDNDIANTILQSGLPIDKQGELVKKYAPGAVRKWYAGVEGPMRGNAPKLSAAEAKLEAQKKELLRALGESVEDIPEPVELTFRDLHSLRTSLRQDINFDRAADGYSAGAANPTLKAIEARLTDNMDRLAKRGGYKKEFDAANQYYRDYVVPHRQGDLYRIRQGRDKAGYVTDDNVMQDLLFSKDAADNVRQLGRIYGWASPQMRMVRDELQARIVQPSLLPGGMVDIAQLDNAVKTINPAVWEAAFGKGSTKKLDKLKSVVNLADFDARKTDPELLRAYFNARTDQQANQALIEIRKYANGQVDDRKYQDKIVKYVIERGDPSLVDPDAVATSLLSLDGKELDRFFSTMPSPNARQSFANAMLVELIARSRNMNGASVRRAYANGHPILFDPDTLLKNLATNEKKLGIAFAGDDTALKNMKSLATAYSSFLEYAARQPVRSGAGVTPYLRTGPDGAVAPRMVLTFGHVAQDLWQKAWERGAPMTESYRIIWSLVAGSDEAMKTAILEANRDPQFKQFMIDNLSSLLSEEGEEEKERR